jgi:hypothetical protein
MGLHRAFASLLLLAACGMDRPPADTGVTGSPLVKTSEDEEPGGDTTAELEGADADDGPTFAPICQAHESRSCLLTWYSVDEPGVKHCRTTTQFCRSDGRGWKDCGLADD